ncbi:MAG: MATE family efflux transporter [Lachnospiraceae bacterium]|nr:MATE family efflux transporter [Lachnospiraceae bacterium]
MSENKALRKQEIFETMSSPRALSIMALPTIASQIIVLVYNIADTWFIGRTNDPHMVGASSLVLTVYFALAAMSNLFGVGGSSLMVRLMGQQKKEDAGRVASYTVAMSFAAAVVFSVLCLIFHDPLLHLLGANENTYEYAWQYLLFAVIIGSVPTVLSMSMPQLLRNAGYSKEAGIGVGMGGILNIALDPLFMFVILTEGYEVMGAAIATMLSNVVSFIYFIIMFRKVREHSVLRLPKRIEKLEKDHRSSFYSVGVPAAMAIFMMDLVNIIINRLTVAYGDEALAGMGIVLKVERLPMNIGLGICLGMVPLVAYNSTAKNFKRMDGFFSAARVAILAVAFVCTALFWFFAESIVGAFIKDPATVGFGIRILKGRCFDIPFMLLGYHIVNFMTATGRGKYSFLLSIIRHALLIVPILFLFNHLFALDGVIWAQTVADAISIVIAYFFYAKVHKEIVGGAAAEAG